MPVRFSVKRLVIAFSSTAEAMAADRLLSAMEKDAVYKGRLIPVPRTISAGCGMAWKDSLENRQIITSALAEAGVETDGCYETDFLEKNAVTEEKREK